MSTLDPLPTQEATGSVMRKKKRAHHSLASHECADETTPAHSSDHGHVHRKPCLAWNLCVVDACVSTDTQPSSPTAGSVLPSFTIPPRPRGDRLAVGVPGNGLPSQLSTPCDLERFLAHDITPFRHALFAQIRCALNRLFDSLGRPGVVEWRESDRHTAFHQHIPLSLGLGDYFLHIATWLQVCTEAALHAVLQVFRLLPQRQPIPGSDRHAVFRLTVHNVHRVLCSALLIQAKFSQEVRFDQTIWSRVSTIPLFDLNDCERLLFALLSEGAFIKAERTARFYDVMMESCNNNDCLHPWTPLPWSACPEEAHFITNAGCSLVESLECASTNASVVAELCCAESSIL